MYNFATKPRSPTINPGLLWSQLMKIASSLSILLGSIVLLAACSSTPVATPAPKPVVSVPTAPAEPVSPTRSAPAAESKVQSAAIPPYLDPKNPLASNRSVWFDYDVFAVKPEFDQVIQLHGKYLVSNPTLTIRVEGNADERGSSEYNLALGQKRAEAVVRALKVFGVASSQLEAVSWGREKPKALGHDEAAWAQNRRVDLAYPTK
jgi:peptidoglycan-associated lipoprotein